MSDINIRGEIMLSIRKENILKNKILKETL